MLFDVWRHVDSDEKVLSTLDPVSQSINLTAAVTALSFKELL